MFDLKMLPVSAGVIVAASIAIAPSSAQAITLTDDANNTYEVTTAQGTFADLLGQLATTPWYNSSTLAEDLADDLKAQLGTPNSPAVPFNEGPYFAFDFSNSGIVSVWNWDGDINMVEIDTENNPFNQEFVWAVPDTTAVPDAAAVPTPALLPALLGMGAGIVRKRKQQAEDA